MKIKSFGCSLIFGNELADDGRDAAVATASQLTWPALIAKQLNADYECYAQPGSGNFRILEKIIHQSGLDNTETLYIIGWTWIERFDFVVDGNHDSKWREHWETISAVSENAQSKSYYRYFHSELRDKLSSLIYIRSAVDILQKKRIPFLMTCVDDLVLDRQWHIPMSVTECQDAISLYLDNFEGLNFISWAQTKKYAMGKWLHPLEKAHEDAAKILSPKVQALLNNKNNLS